LTTGAHEPHGETSGAPHPPQPACADVGSNATEPAIEAANATNSAEETKRDIM
jgi:hypothetical protein